MNCAIRVEHLGKRYRLRTARRERYSTLRDVIAHKARNLLRPTAAVQAEEEDFWALKEVNFSVREGEVVGIIGRNGAGKSTLLKTLSRITEPTEGRITLRGRVASLLEAGTGFHPELTGRENIFLNGAILGMSRTEILAKFKEIVTFAELDKFIETPVKRYSSGMYVRLAFAVAAHLEPEILIVDEVLAVGDAAFQKKCLGKMHDVAVGGRTVLFVSHDLGAIRKLTSRCLVLAAGTVAFDGTTDAAIASYMAATPKTANDRYDVTTFPRFVAGTGAARFTTLAFEESPALYPTGKDLAIIAEVTFVTSVRHARISLTIRTPDSSPVCSGFGPANIQCDAPGDHRLTVRLPTGLLVAGSYYCTVAMSAAVGPGEAILDAVTDVLHFELFPGDNTRHEPSPWRSSWGTVRLPELSVEMSA